jgi:hypothetical protein
VYNPTSKQELLANFKTTTPRVITICLDLNQNKVKFWLNDRRNPSKDLNVPDGSGPWIPCVKITQEKNKLILNPFAREPSDFFEKEFDRIFTLKKYVMPHLNNMVCICKSSSSEVISADNPEQRATKFLTLIKEICKVTTSDIKQVLMPISFP